MNLEAYFFIGMAIGAGMWLAPLVLTAVLSAAGVLLGIIAAVVVRLWKGRTK